MPRWQCVLTMPGKKQTVLPVDHFVDVDREIVERQDRISFKHQAAFFIDGVGFVGRDQRDVFQSAFSCVFLFNQRDKL